MFSPFSRRKFLASSSALLVTASLPGAEPDKKESLADAAKLALDGGEKAVKHSYPHPLRWGDPEREQLLEMLKQSSLFYWKGPRTKLLIERFQKHYPLKYVQTCSSGTAALHIAVGAAGIGPGDEVITTPISDIGTVIGILFQQAVPVFAELEPNTYNLSAANVEQKITPKTKAIIVVHLAGNSCDMNPLKALADKHGLILIEDCAQAWGTTYRGQPTGTIGHIACFSLQDSKLITAGDGGLVASSDPRFGPALQKFGDKGMDRLNQQDSFAVLAANYRMSEPQAAVAAAQMERMENIAATRARLGNLLTKEISGIAGIQPHQVHPEDRCSYWFYMLRIQPEKFRCDAAKFAKALQAEGAACAAGYIPTPLYRFPVFQKHAFFAGRWPIKELGLTTMDYTKVNCPEAEAILKTCVRVIISEAMDEDYIHAVAQAIRKVAKHFAA